MATMVEAPVAPAVKTSNFETRVCSRCGGSGTYSHCSFYGDTCFKCGGKPHVPGSGFALTKAGSEARAAWMEANTRRVRADEVKVGDRVVENSGVRWTVSSVEVAEPGKDFGAGSSDGGKTWTHYTVGLVRGTGDREVRYVKAPDDKVTLWTGAVAAPPAVEAGINRAKEMREYIKAVAS